MNKSKLDMEIIDLPERMEFLSKKPSQDPKQYDDGYDFEFSAMLERCYAREQKGMRLLNDHIPLIYI